MELFTLAPNLTDIKCSFDLNHNASLPMITHCNLISLTTDPHADVLRYLTLPALRYLDVSIHDEDCYEPERHEDSSHPLNSFLVRSSPPLVTLSISFLGGDEDAYDVESYHLAQCMRLVGRTLESLECWRISNDLMPSIFGNLRPDSLPHIQKFGFKDIYGPLDLPIFVHLLYRFDKLRTAAFVWKSSLFLNQTIAVYTSTAARRIDTISGHLSHLAQKGMEIYLGTDEKNYLSNSKSCNRAASHVDLLPLFLNNFPRCQFCPRHFAYLVS
ncbi:hypothetical protein MSAN_01489800 [Mycena sanguinolenta]|uniref:Uncharacterized protein n=1 Tax=Mycena sanguinolenta TaxID=230812 RepID=A0A8H7CYX4_9AGAR|nr:hypothetical protein MSAN_01489800 [Mycena sanguinolenta]